MKIIAAEVSDSVLVARFVVLLLEELTGEGGLDPEDFTVTAASLLGRDDVAGFIAYEGDRPVGLIMLNQCAAIYAGGLFGEITEMYVLPEMRSNGVAQQLLLKAQDLGRKRAWTRLEVGAPDQPTWQRTLGFYQREGFQETGPRLRMLL